MLFQSTNWGAQFSALLGGRSATQDQRHIRYARFLRAYQGYKTPAVGNTARTASQEALRHSRLRYNFNRPIVELGAAFLAGSPLGWKIDPSDDSEGAKQRAELMQADAFSVWDRSGSDRAMLEAARSAGIYGDMAALATQDEEQRPRIQFVSPDICTPEFQGNDAQKLTLLQIAWEEERGQERVRYLETCGPEGREVRVNGEIDEAQSVQFDGYIPAAWIRNLSIKGESFGYSDLDGVVDLVEAYDHVQGKREKIIDYYAAPSIVAEGVSKTDVTKDIETMFFPPAGSKVYFLEWSGSAPDVEQHLDRIWHDIEVISATPGVAFGQTDTGLGAISGVALRIRYGPLLNKTNAKRASWGPALEYLMWLCLRALGHDVEPGHVNVVWPDPVPQNESELVESESRAVESGIHSKRTAMGHLGIEDPEAEYQKIREENRAKLIAEGVDAGLSFEAAALEAGVEEKALPALSRRDRVGITQ